jgi:DNA repair ATPase RecN
MNIAKALKAKNQLINEINKLKAKVKNHNSIVKGNEQTYDISALLQQLDVKSQELVKLKVKLTQANAVVQDKIYEIGELKAMITFYREIPVKQGKVSVGYNNELVEYEAQFKQKDKDEAIEKLEQGIIKLQDELDTFNYTTTITIN